MKYKNKSLALDEINLEASRYEGERVIKIESTLVDTEIKGTYSVSNLSKDIRGNVSTTFFGHISRSRFMKDYSEHAQQHEVTLAR